MTIIDRLSDEQLIAGVMAFRLAGAASQTVPVEVVLALLASMQTDTPQVLLSGIDAGQAPSTLPDQQPKP